MIIRDYPDFEKGTTSVTISDLLKLAHVLDISLCTVICTAEKFCQEYAFNLGDGRQDEIDSNQI